MKITLIADPEPQGRVYYTDGSCWPNPGPGGWAVVTPAGESAEGPEVFVPAAGGHELLTSNVKMEGTAIIEAMKLADGEPVEIITDSKLWVDTLITFAPRWREWGWAKKDGGIIKNLAMVKEALALYEVGNVRLTHVRGHQGNPGNEAADVYADEMRKAQEAENDELKRKAATA